MNIKTEYGNRRLCVIHKSVTGSTNADALGAPENTLLVADVQIAGRGRLGRSFASPPGGVYMTLTVGFKEGGAGFLTTAAAAAAARATEGQSGVKTYIKWVNDLYQNGKKICGILAQSQTANGQKSNTAALGLGLNLVKTADFEDDLKNKAGHVFSSGDFNKLREEFIDRFLSEFFAIYDHLDRSLIYREYTARDMLRGKNVTYARGDSILSGVALGVDKDINYLVKRDGAVERLFCGEVTLKSF